MCKSLNKISCPRCHSHNLCRFGKDKAGNQKYQCKDCRRQFTLEDCSGKKNRVLTGFPRCPVCGHGMYLDHDYEYYFHYTCNVKKCGHSIYVAIPNNIHSASCELIRGFELFDNANTLIAMFIFHYNFLRPYYFLDNLTPAQVGGILVNEKGY